jgi:hypothetical protein
VSAIQLVAEIASPKKSSTELALLDNLTYYCYRHNRKLSPEISPEQWARIFGSTEAFEVRFQKEQVLNAA